MELTWKLFRNNNFQENCSSKANFTGNILEILNLQQISKIFQVKFTLGKYKFLGNCHLQIIFFCNFAAFLCFGNVTSFPVYLHGEGFALLG